MVKRLVDAREMGRLLSVRPSTVYKWVHEGRIPYYKIGKAVRFNEEEIWQWVKKHRSNNRVRAVL